MILYQLYAETEVHIDASSLALAGMIPQLGEDKKFHPAAYYSRQTTGVEPSYHSYELEPLAVLETVCEYRSYLLNIHNCD